MRVRLSQHMRHCIAAAVCDCSGLLVWGRAGAELLMDAYMSGIFAPHELEFLASTLPSQPCARIDTVELLMEAQVLSNGEDWFSRLNCRDTRAAALSEMQTASVAAHKQQLEQQRALSAEDARASAEAAKQQANARADTARERYAHWALAVGAGVCHQPADATEPRQHRSSSSRSSSSSSSAVAVQSLQA
jgi:hypothetical protein